jgi:three-Cys-motif partner protein
VSSGYDWDFQRPPKISEHSLVKHGVYRSYLKQYLRELTKGFGYDRFRINIVDGFAGGGIYQHPTSGETYFGSPIQLLQTLHEMQAELQAKQKKPFLLDYTVHLVEKDKSAVASLRKTLEQSGLLGLEGTRLFIHQGEFERWLPSILDFVQRRGQTIFILDQYGYQQVPLRVLSGIFAHLTRPEVILTFAYEHLEGFVQQFDQLNKALNKLGVGAIDREQYEASMRVSGGREFFIQRVLHKAFLSHARYFTPFFIRSRESNLAFWLVHLSIHARARDVMTELHWGLQNHFGHYGGPGTHMLGFDPAHSGDDRQPFLFDDSARTRTMSALRDQLPRLIRSHGDGVEFGTFYSFWANESPATSGQFAEAIGDLAVDKIVTIKTAAGGLKRNLRNIQMTDRIALSKQLILPISPNKRR